MRRVKSQKKKVCKYVYFKLEQAYIIKPCSSRQQNTFKQCVLTTKQSQYEKHTKLEATWSLEVGGTAYRSCSMFQNFKMTRRINLMHLKYYQLTN